MAARAAARRGDAARGTFLPLSPEERERLRVLGYTD
jgi:hypothetical protein